MDSETNPASTTSIHEIDNHSTRLPFPEPQEQESELSRNIINDHPLARRSSRTRKTPDYLEDYVSAATADRSGNDATPSSQKKVFRGRLSVVCIPSILLGTDVAVAAETGSGKTHGHLIPLINKLCGTSDVPESELGDHKLKKHRQLSLVLCPNAMLLGRTARAGQPGLVTSLYTEANRDVVSAVRQAEKLGLTMVSVNAVMLHPFSWQLQHDGGVYRGELSFMNLVYKAPTI
ncbi:unnamed protein product [Fraxinus pennsylvanica]|uniref:DEAD/DEAH-box helicase domain-containing protein n=1 Tax=Fraxinus pennsylvanica TaxID=56036 RepID=A0AAD1Z2S8_9LAMI|nr:unnamed protein product [Fraxinus pennsylvanica]